MPKTSADQRDFERLELRIQTILPEEYQDCYEEVQPVSMGSAGLKYGRDGKVAWSDIWQTFCDLAMAGGPPHKGKLLQAGTQEEIDANPDGYRGVVEEICRGVEMVAFLPASESPTPGWVRVTCESAGMAGWLARAIAMENVSVHCEGAMLDLPAGPAYRLEKEIKNVITVIAKTCHYWRDHMWNAQHRVISDMFASMEADEPLIQAARAGHDPELRRRMSEAIGRNTDLVVAETEYPGWLGLKCPSVRAAIWMMRAIVASNVFARREETVLFVPVNPLADPNGTTVIDVTCRVFGFAQARGIF